MMSGYGTLRVRDRIRTNHLTSYAHHYEVFDSSALQMSPDDHVSTACGFGSQMASNNKWTIAGEWSGALTDCAKVSKGPLFLTPALRHTNHITVAQRPWHRRKIRRHLQQGRPRILIHRLMRRQVHWLRPGPQRRRPLQHQALHRSTVCRFREGRRLDLLDMEDRERTWYASTFTLLPTEHVY